MKRATPLDPIGSQSNGQRHDYSRREDEIPGVPPRSDLEARLRLILVRAEEVRSHPGWPNALDKEPMFAQALNMIVCDTCMLLYRLYPCSEVPTDEAALEKISSSADMTLIALEEGIARLNAYQPQEPGTG